MEKGPADDGPCLSNRLSDKYVSCSPASDLLLVSNDVEGGNQAFLLSRDFSSTTSAKASDDEASIDRPQDLTCLYDRQTMRNLTYGLTDCRTSHHRLRMEWQWNANLNSYEGIWRRNASVASKTSLQQRHEPVQSLPSFGFHFAIMS